MPILRVAEHAITIRDFWLMLQVQPVQIAEEYGLRIIIKIGEVMNAVVGDTWIRHIVMACIEIAMVRTKHYVREMVLMQTWQ